MVKAKEIRRILSFTLIVCVMVFAYAPLHAGADAALVRDFFGSIAAEKEPSATLHSAFPGHLLCYKAERQ